MSVFIRSLLLTCLGMCLPAMAQATPTLVVYTYDSFTSDWGPGPQVKTAFEARCNCTSWWNTLCRLLWWLWERCSGRAA